MDEQEQPTTERLVTESSNHGTLRAGSGIRAERNEDCCEAARPMEMAERIVDDRPTGIQGRKGIREVSIKQLNYGYIVGVGCHNFAFETPDKLIEKLSEYLKDPKGTEEKWFKGDLL